MISGSREVHRTALNRNYQSEEYILSSNLRRVGSLLDNLRLVGGTGRRSSAAGTSLWVTEKWHSAKACLVKNRTGRLWKAASAAHCSINARKLGHNGHDLL